MRTARRLRAHLRRPLTGDAFTNKFRIEPLSALFIQIRYAMPPATADVAKLTSEQAAHILKSNRLPAGKADFAATDAADSRILFAVVRVPTEAEFLIVGEERRRTVRLALTWAKGRPFMMFVPRPEPRVDSEP